MKKTLFAIANLLLTISTASYGNPAKVNLQLPTDSLHTTENESVILLCQEELFDDQQPIANGFLPAIIALESGNATYKTKYNGSLTTSYKGGVYPAGTRVSGFKWYEISAHSHENESLTFSLTYNNSLNAWGHGQLVVPGSEAKHFLTSCTAIQDLL